ncbi:helix-turn-helix domain-containing protein [Bacillus altitudinis]|uniref:helix-turn-helix domain-containing protein n=1 Tax=Bacillus altitudinis TaxID=293387 RepID=UPI001F60AF10|nr:helix-turn-helix transcriptional regulator [Bacillus altitudinis]
MIKSNRELKDFIRIKRAVMNISSSDLSRTLGKNRSYVSQIENGYNKKPEYLTMKKMFGHLGLAEDEIEITLRHFNIIPTLEEQMQMNSEKVETLETNEKCDSIKIETNIGKPYNELETDLEKKIKAIAKMSIALIDIDKNAAEKLSKELEKVALRHIASLHNEDVD